MVSEEKARKILFDDVAEIIYESMIEKEMPDKVKEDVAKSVYIELNNLWQRVPFKGSLSDYLSKVIYPFFRSDIRKYGDEEYYLDQISELMVLYSKEGEN